MSAGYEKKDVSLKGITLIGIVSIIFVIASVIAATEYYSSVKEETFNEMAMKPVSKKLIELRKHEQTLLTGYSVLDKDNGIYQIPINVAIKQVANSY
jgi:hypothetical protein